MAYQMNSCTPDLVSKQAGVTWIRGSTAIIIGGLKYDTPKDQTETEIQAAVTRAARRELKELLRQLGDD